jgi:hypothetical protein
LPTTHEVIRKQRWRLPDEAARKHRLYQKDLQMLIYFPYNAAE